MASYDFERGELNFLDIISFISLLIGLENLKLNEVQVNSIMSELMEKQDSALDVIIEQNKQIIEQNKVIMKLLEEHLL